MSFQEISVFTASSYNQTKQNELTKDSAVSNYEDFYETERLVNVYISPALVLGSVGNLLAFFVMRRGSLKDVSTCSICQCWH